MILFDIEEYKKNR